MAAKHTWTFKSRLRSRAFGWKGSHLACQRLKEAVAEIKKVARTDPVTAGDGIVGLMERIWPAFQDIDTSSGALGGAVYWAQDELLPIAIEAPADRKTRDKWLDRIWQAIEDDGVDYLSLAGERWGELCRSREVASHWADRFLGLAARIEEGQRPVRVAALAPFRLSFRLHEPENAADDWQVKYLLQGTKDPSLLVPAGDAWRRKCAAAFGSDPAALREHLLASLGQAAALCPHVEASLKRAAPEGYPLDATGAYQFLRETAGALEQSGFGVMLPSWWTRRGTQTRLQAHARVKSPAAASAGLSLEALVEFDWEVALGGEKMSRAELAALARLKQPLVKLRGQWVEVDAAQIQAALDFLKRNPSGRATAREVMRMAIGVEGHAGPLEIGGVEATGWMGDLLARLEGRAPFAELPQPEALTGTLRPYQLRGYSWLDFLKRLGLGACLADDMGLGKTVQK